MTSEARPGAQEQDLPTIRMTVEDSIAWIMMNRPASRNAESSQLIRERDVAVRTADEDPAIRVIVIGAEGPSFSAGHDLKEVSTSEALQRIRADTDSRTAFEWRYYYEASIRIQRLNTPTIAMVQGACVASGFMLAAMCDLVVAADDARFRDPLLGFASMPDAGQAPISAVSTEVLFHPWSLGIRKAKELLFTGDWLSAAEAQQCGFVNRVVRRDELETETRALASRIAAASPDAISLVKHSLQFAQDAMGMGAAQQFHFLLHQLRHCGLSDTWLRSPALDDDV